MQAQNLVRHAADQQTAQRPVAAGAQHQEVVTAVFQGIGDRFRGVTLAYNVRSKEAVDALLQQAAEAGGVIQKPAQDVFWGGYSGYFEDPDGHLWEVAWNPDFTTEG